MLETFGRTFLAIGPPLILLAGTAVTVIVASAIQGSSRWWVLAAGPALSLAMAVLGVYVVLEVIDPVEGSGFLLGGAALGLYAVAAAVYYPVLAVVGLLQLWRR